MHILALLLVVIGSAATWYWRFKVGREAASEVADAVGRLQGKYRTGKFRKQAEGSVLSTIVDPAMAAAILLFALASEDSASLHVSEAVIRDQIGKVVTPEALDETLAYARWAARETLDARDIVRRFKPLWREKLTREERADLIDMAEAVAAVRTGDAHNQKLTLASLRMALGPEQNR